MAVVLAACLTAGPEAWLPQEETLRAQPCCTQAAAWASSRLYVVGSIVLLARNAKRQQHPSLLSAFFPFFITF